MALGLGGLPWGRGYRVLMREDGTRLRESSPGGPQNRSNGFDWRCAFVSDGAMRSVPFAKYHGLGNDFILIDEHEAGGRVTASGARRLCARHRGIGADGVLSLLLPTQGEAVRRMHIYNADGSVAEMCGNGLRCAVRLLAEGGDLDSVLLETDGGLREGWFEADSRVRASLGRALVLHPGLSVSLDGESRQGIGLSLGNPHLVLKPFDVGTDLRALAERHGPVLERDPRFPEGANVGFFSAAAPGQLKLVVFERGVGITEACGTGAGAATVAAIRFGLPNPRASWIVQLPGGDLEIAAEETSTDAVYQATMRGEACPVFRGEVLLTGEEWIGS